MAISGDVTCLVQANNGWVLAGTNDSARIYRSSDNGLNWTQIISFGSNSAVTGLAKDNSGRIFASVQLGAASQGVWRSLDHGVTWTRVATNPLTQNGYLDITVIRPNNRVVAVGYGTSAGAGNVISSSDGGDIWITNDVGTTNRAYQVDRVASSEIGPLAWFFFGPESAIATQVLTTYADGNLSILRGSPRGGGLDLAIFGLTNASGATIERRVAAFRMGSDTEIWQHVLDSLHAGGPTQAWTKIATIAGKKFNCLYVDTTPTQAAQQRTLWAGADGEIWVSYNNGLAWAVATTAPTGNIYSFVRTTSGVLIAGGESGEIFLFTGGGSEGGGDPEEPPVEEPEEPEEPPTEPEEPEEPEEPTDPGIVTSRFLGRAASTGNETYVANKFSYSNLTHVFYYNGSDYINLQFGAEPPYSIFGANPTVGRALYLGSNTGDVNIPGGTFSSAVFDITRAARDLTIAWEYWDGSSWQALDVQDGTENFVRLGVRSVHWVIPEDWDTTTVSGVTGYWVRARITALEASSLAPVHGNRYIYTVNLPYVEIPASQVGGDIPALARIKWHNRGDNLASDLGMEVDRIVCGLRLLERGGNFNSFLNISDSQTPFGITVEEGEETVWEDNFSAPTGRSLEVSYSSVFSLNEWNDLVTFTIANTVAREFYGRFRLFLRCYKLSATSQDWQIRVRTTFGSGGGSSDSSVAFPTALTDWEVLDLKQISIPTTQVAQQAGNLGDQLSLTIQGKCSAVDSSLRLYDLILIPVDEWAMDARPPKIQIAMTSQIKGNNFLDIDSIGNPKSVLAVLNRNQADQIVSRYQALNNGPAILQAGQAQRLWFLEMATNGISWYGYPHLAGSVQVYKQQRYLGLRGES